MMGFYKKYGMYYKSICPRQNISVNVFSYIIGAVAKACSYHYSGIDIFNLMLLVNNNMLGHLSVL
jgi:hypothetical protein